MRRIEALRGTMRTMQSSGHFDEMIFVLEEISHYMKVRKELAQYIGDRIVPAKSGK